MKLDLAAIFEQIRSNPRTSLHGLAVCALVLGGTEAPVPYNTYLFVAGALAGVVLGFLAKDPDK